LSPRLVGRIGGKRRARDQASLGYLIALAEEVQEDVGRLSEAQVEGSETPSLGLSARIALRNDATRAAFVKDVQTAFEALARKYGATGGKKKDEFKIALACYPARGRSAGAL